MDILFFPAMMLIIVVVALGIKSRLGIPNTPTETKKAPYAYGRKQSFMTRAESECFNALLVAVNGEYHIFAQAYLPSIVDHKIKGQNWKGAWAHINRKSVDFVLCDKQSLSPKLAIELDDKTHALPDRVERDIEVGRILQAAGLPLLRLQNTGSFNPVDIAAKIRGKLS